MFYTPRYFKLSLALATILQIASSSGAFAAETPACIPKRTIQGTCSGLSDDQRVEITKALQAWMLGPSSGIAKLSGSIHLSIDGVEAGGFTAGWAEKSGTNQGTWIPIDTDPRNPTLFPVASVTKVYTAALIWKRIAAGLLKPESKIADFVPFLNDPNTYAKEAKLWAQITVGELLSHTSGINDLPNHGGKAWVEAYTQDWSVDKIIAYVQLMPINATDETTNHDLYSNSGYTILARALESAALNGGTARALADTIQQEIIAPLGFQHTGVLTTNRLDDHTFALPKLGTVLDTTLDLRVPPMFFGAGDMYSTAEELDAWVIALMVKRTVVPSGVVSRMWTSPPSSPSGRTQGMTIAYKAGYQIVYKTGHLITHTGEIAYANAVAYVPEYGITVAILQNGNTIGSVATGEHAVYAATDAILTKTAELIQSVEAGQRAILP